MGTAHPGRAFLYLSVDVGEQLADGVMVALGRPRRYGTPSCYYRHNASEGSGFPGFGCQGVIGREIQSRKNPFT